MALGSHLGTWGTSWRNRVPLGLAMVPQKVPNGNPTGVEALFSGIQDARLAGNGPKPPPVGGEMFSLSCTSTSRITSLYCSTRGKEAEACDVNHDVNCIPIPLEVLIETCFHGQCKKKDGGVKS